MTLEQRLILIEAIKNARGPIAVFSLGAVSAFSPAIHAGLGLSDGGNAMFTTAECSVIRQRSEGAGSLDDGSYALPLKPSFEYVQANPATSLHFISRFIGDALLHVSEVIKNEVGAWPHTPEFQFLRQCRNAIGHGNRILMKEREPRASFKGYTISPVMNGQRLFTDSYGKGFFFLGDALALLDHLELFLVAGEEA